MRELSTNSERPNIESDKLNLVKDDQETVFQNSTTLKIYLYLRSTKKKVGTRETQRDLRINNPQTVSWHMDKLIEIGLVEKTPSTKYHLTKEGKELSDLSLPIEFPFILIRGFLVPKSNLLISFSVLSVFVYLFLVFVVRFTPWIITFGILSLTIHSILLIIDRIKLQGRFQQFLDN